MNVTVFFYYEWSDRDERTPYIAESINSKPSSVVGRPGFGLSTISNIWLAEPFFTFITREKTLF